MREIKFRYVFKHKHDHTIRTELFSLSEVESYGVFGKEHITEYFGDYFECIAREQFIGLPDKNGQEIYEGDIMPYKNDICIVEYVDDMFHLKSTKYKNLSKGNYRLASLHSRLEKIGNIYENKNLIKGE